MGEAKPEAQHSKLKKVLAVIGALYLVAFAGYGVYALIQHSQEEGATELAASPEKQDEILAGREAAKMRDALGLSDAQTAEIEAILLEGRKAAHQPRSREDMRGVSEGRRQKREKIEAVLTEEQRAKFAESPMGRQRGPGGRGQFRGPGGPGGPGGDRMERFREILEKNNIDPEEFRKLPREERRERMRELMRESGMEAPALGGRRGRPRGQ